MAQEAVHRCCPRPGRHLLHADAGRRKQRSLFKVSGFLKARINPEIMLFLYIKKFESIAKANVICHVVIYGETLKGSDLLVDDTQ